MLWFIAKHAGKALFSKNKLHLYNVFFSRGYMLALIFVFRGGLSGGAIGHAWAKATRPNPITCACNTDNASRYIFAHAIFWVITYSKLKLFCDWLFS